MELAEPISLINQKLIDLFGIDTSTGRPIWRVVWSEDQYEKRLVDTTDEGLTLLYPIVREVPKYRQWIKQKYVLERLVVIPEVNLDELPTQKLSYEPMFPFEDANGNYLPPKLEVCKIVIDTVHAALGKQSLAKYKDPDRDCVDPEIAIAKKRAHVDEIYSELFGNETNVTDALAYGTGVVVPKEKES